MSDEVRMWADCEHKRSSLRWVNDPDGSGTLCVAECDECGAIWTGFDSTDAGAVWGMRMAVARDVLRRAVVKQRRREVPGE